VAQSVGHLTLDFGSSHDLGVVSLSPMSGSVLGVEPSWDFLSISLSAPLPTHAQALSK